jgi:hypothetical protein
MTQAANLAFFLFLLSVGIPAVFADKSLLAFGTRHREIRLINRQMRLSLARSKRLATSFADQCLLTKAAFNHGETFQRFRGQSPQANVGGGPFKAKTAGSMLGGQSLLVDRRDRSGFGGPPET